MATSQRTRWIPNPLKKIFFISSFLLITGCNPVVGAINAGNELIPTIATTTELVYLDISTVTPSTLTLPATATEIPLKTPEPSPTIQTPDVNVVENPNLYVPLFDFPIPPEGFRQLETSYRFGSTLYGERIPHDGIEILNPEGTPVLAAEDGVVIFSGNDRTFKRGRFTNFYGNIIIIKHELKNYPQTIYSMYAHLSELLVSDNDVVKRGQTIGLVGASGKAFTNHLHFEVRVGDILLPDARNPELFLPLIPSENQPQVGILIGKLLSINGDPIHGASIVVQRVVDGVTQPGSPLYLETYAKTISGEEKCNENFVASNIPVGDYRVSTFAYGTFIEQFITIQENEFTFITLQPEE